MILLTGSTGYIGSHVWLELLLAGHEVIGVDNFVNSNPSVLGRLELLASQKLNFMKGDVSDPIFLNEIFKKNTITGVMHFAALKAVGESVQSPLSYYRNNLMGLISLLEASQSFGCSNFVFSSSATVYGNPDCVPISETASLRPTSPYGHTKLMSEQILGDLAHSNPVWRIACLRYFNPVGAHESGLIGEDPLGMPNNLSPLLGRVAAGEIPHLNIYGDDWPTPDGTGVRDYIHVLDLAHAHVLAMEALFQSHPSFTVNLGTGRGYSVLEILGAYERASGRPVPYEIAPRRPGDIATCYADTELAATLLNWRSRFDLDRMCVDSWRWQSQSTKENKLS